MVSRVLLAVTPLLFGYALWRNALNVRYVAQPPDTMERVADWLAARKLI